MELQVSPVLCVEAQWPHGYSVLASGSNRPSSSHGWGHLSLTVPLSTQWCRWVTTNLLLGGNPAMD